MSTPERTSNKPSRKRATITTDLTPQIGKNDIKRSALETWRKLDEVIQTELASVQKGEKELNASTATAIIKYIEASMSLATGSEDVSEKDQRDRNNTMFAKLTLPTFNDDEDFNAYDNNNKNPKGN